MARRGLRVVAGRAGGLRLVAPNGARPTTDRVKEAMFAALGTRVADATVLDLYAGSGALAIEALSRGAAQAVLVDRDRRAADACRRNLATTRLEDRARVQCGTVAGFLRSGPPTEAPFEVVLLDPPYDMPSAEVDRALGALAGPGWLASGAVAVVERAAAEPLRAPAGWTTVWERAYGDTLVVILALA